MIKKQHKQKNIKNLIKSILGIMLVIITFTTMYIPKTVKAKNITEADLYSKENLYCFRSKGYLYRSEFVVYEQDGKEYPAYCLNRELDGVSIEHGGYTVQIQDKITDDLIWRAIINGYPYKTYQELGCNNEMEAFTATKIAVYDMMYNYNWNDFVPENEIGERVVAAMKNISYEARNSTQVRVQPEIEIISQSDEWKVDENYKSYVYKIFKVKPNAEMSNYIIETNNISGIKITDEKNIEKNVFDETQMFKILVPIEQLNENNEIEINVRANLKTYPIYYGKAPDNLQNYALCASEFECVEKSITEELINNETTLKIIKVDGDTNEPLKDCIFTIEQVDNSNKICVITNEDGIIEIPGIIPGEYIIKEEKSINGYINGQYEEKIELKLNEKQDIVVKNYKIIEKPLIDEKPTEEVIKLPKTGF